MSLYSFFTAGLAYAALASAYTQPKGDSPSGNPISQPGLNSIVPAGQSFSVTWEPTTQGTVTLVLLKGPSTNAEPQYAIAENIPNNGLYAWTPSTDLAPTSDATGYGIQLIDDSTGAYQYTTQFGISNDNYVASSSSSASATTSSWSVPVHSGPPGHGHGGSWTDSWSDSWTTTATGSWSTTVSGKPHSYNSTWTSTTVAPIVTGAPSASYTSHNVTMVSPTGAITVPSSLLTSATATSASATRTSATGSATQSANAAAGMKASFAGLVFAGAVAVFAL